MLTLLANQQWDEVFKKLQIPDFNYEDLLSEELSPDASPEKMSLCIGMAIRVVCSPRLARHLISASSLSPAHRVALFKVLLFSPDLNVEQKSILGHQLLKGTLPTDDEFPMGHIYSAFRMAWGVKDAGWVYSVMGVAGWWQCSSPGYDPRDVWNTLPLEQAFSQPIVSFSCLLASGWTLSPHQQLDLIKRVFCFAMTYHYPLSDDNNPLTGWLRWAFTLLESRDIQALLPYEDILGQNNFLGIFYDAYRFSGTQLMPIFYRNIAHFPWTSTNLLGNTPLHCMLKNLDLCSNTAIEFLTGWVELLAFRDDLWMYPNYSDEFPLDVVDYKSKITGRLNILVAKLLLARSRSLRTDDDLKNEPSSDLFPDKGLGLSLCQLVKENKELPEKWFDVIWSTIENLKLDEAKKSEAFHSIEDFWMKTCENLGWDYADSTDDRKGKNAKKTDAIEPPPLPASQIPVWPLYNKASIKELEVILEDEGDEDNKKRFKSLIKKAESKLNTEGVCLRPLSPCQGVLDSLAELRMSFPHFSEVIDHFRTHTTLQMKGDGAFWLPPLLLVGSPGIGKTFFLHELARRVETDFHVLNMESKSAGFSLTGLASGYSTSRQGLIFTHAMESEKGNPIFLLDEIDKSPDRGNYPVSQVLLPLLEPQTAANFRDDFAVMPLDLRRVIWIASANNLNAISSPLRSRFDVFNVPDPDTPARMALTQGVFSSLRKQFSWGPAMDDTLSHDFLEKMVLETTSARDIRRILNTACAHAICEGRTSLLPKDIVSTTQIPRAIWDAPPKQDEIKPPREIQSGEIQPGSPPMVETPRSKSQSEPHESNHDTQNIGESS